MRVRRQLEPGDPIGSISEQLIGGRSCTVWGNAVGIPGDAGGGTDMATELDASQLLVSTHFCVGGLYRLDLKYILHVASA
jgi:hypothetical protein